jgi:hypothetical protein
MNPTKAITSLLGVLALVTLGIVGLVPMTLHAQGKQTKPPTTPQVFPRAGLYLGPVSCASGNCHGKSTPQNQYAVRQDEYYIWAKTDKHSKAYSVLLNLQSKVIAQNLKLKEKPNESRLCLDCHALNPPTNAQAKPLDIGDGVSCESCHGPASGWITKHTESSWEKERKKLIADGIGMKDLRSPGIRAQNCLQCHSGTANSGVGHELIAAGHPALKFELDNYGDQMRHWMSFATRMATRKTADGRDQSEGGRAWVVGQVVAFKMALDLLAHRAKLPSWPDFAEMDCHACHHSLKDASQRQAKVAKAGLGIPKWSPAHLAMLRHIVAVFASKEDLRSIESGTSELAALMIKGIATGTTIAPLASRLANSMTPIIKKLEQVQIDAVKAKQFIDLIVKDTATNLPATDIRSLQQVVMGLNTLASDIAQTNRSVSKSEVQKVLGNLYRQVEIPEKFDPNAFRKQLTELQRLLDART